MQSARQRGWRIVERTPRGVRLGMGLFELGQLASQSQVDDELAKMKSEIGSGDKQKELQQ